ncbi:CoA transferase [Mycolicibacterium thermoresistibile]
MSALHIPPAVLARAHGIAEQYRAATGVAVDAEELLTGRAALLGFTANGRISAGGATRLLSAADGWCALTLSRDDDIAAVPALVESDADPDDPWPAVTAWVASRPAAEAIARARLLGLPAAVLGETSASPPVLRRLGSPTGSRSARGLLVADLSSMWAGPLCGQLLLRASATVVKVESAARPDGTRSGPPAFFDWMNSGKLSYSVSFERPAEVRALLTVADVVIEGSRPAALIRRGLGPDDIPGRAGRVWIRISGHGTSGERADWVAFGDDAAVSGGLVATTADGPMFCGDAIADPLTGLHAALATVESLQRGGGELIEISMAATAAGYAALPPVTAPTARFRPPAPVPAAAPLGADNTAVDHIISERSVTAC